MKMNVIVGQYDNPRFDDGPTQNGLLHSPVGTACMGSSLYIAEHPADRQGFIRLFQYLLVQKSFCRYGTWLARHLG